MAQRRPRREKLYAAMEPMPAMRRAAGMEADGASPNAAIPFDEKYYVKKIMMHATWSVRIEFPHEKR